MGSKRPGIVLLLALMLLVSVVIVPVAGAKTIEKQKDKLSATPWYDKGDELNRLTTDEIQRIAKTNESVRKLIKEDLRLEPIQTESMDDFEDMPANYPESLKLGAMKNLTSANSEQILSATASTITVYVWIVADEEYRSYYGSNWKSKAYNAVETADNAFYSDHNINFVVSKYTEWDSNDNVHDSRLLSEAQSEAGWNTNHQGMDMMAIFTNQKTDNRGWSEIGGDAWIMKHQISATWDWHLAQHEASHNYYCPDHGYLGTVCIMTYTYMMITDDWCANCDRIIETNRNHF